MQRDPLGGDVARLAQQATSFRRRVGEWRVFFDLDLERRLVEIRFIERRTTTTYRRRR